MTVQEGAGCFYWVIMLFFFGVGLATFPFGIAVWLIQIVIFVKTQRGPGGLDDNEQEG